VFSDARVEQELERIFGDPAYERGFREIAPPPSLVSFFRGIWERITEWLRALNESFQGLNARSPLLFWLLFAGLTIVLLLLLLHIGWTLRLALRAKPPAREDEEPHAPKRTRAQQLLAESRELASRGRYAEALRLLFLALLSALHDKEIAVAPESWTNHEIVGALRVPEDLRMRLARVADAFDRGWYGQRELAADLYAFCRETIVGFMHGLGKKTGPAPPTEPGGRGRP
jgi:hypothetical protein